MSQPEEEIVEKVAPFDTDKFLERLKEGAAKADAERKEVFLTAGLGNNDQERIREAVQREKFWRAQPPSDHRDEQLAHAAFAQGRIDEALKLAKEPARRAYYETIRDAIEKDDNEFCGCPESETVPGVLVNGKPVVNQLWMTTGYYPSAKHGGQMIPIQKCAVCGFTNITSL